MASARIFAVASVCLFAFGATAQPLDPNVSRMIDQLRPGPATRGIRVPGAEAPAVEPSRPSTPAAVVRPSGDPSPRASTPAAVVRPPAQVQTTAPEGTPAIALTLRFATASATLTPEAMRALDTLGRALSSPELSPFRFRIEGHTDTVGSEQLNRALSEQRAAAVREYLMQRYQIAPARLEAVGFGSSQLLVATPPQTPEQRNRRVQILNLGS